MVRNGGYTLLLNGEYCGYNPLILTIDPNFLGHPSITGGGFLISSFLGFKMMGF